MFRNLIALAPKKKVGAAAAVAAKAKKNAAATKKKSPSPKKAKLSVKKNKATLVSAAKKKDIIDSRLDQLAVDHISDDIKAALAEVVSAEVKSFGFGIKRTPVKAAEKHEEAVAEAASFDTVDTAAEVPTPAKIHLTENDEACFTADTQNQGAEEPSAELPSAEKVEAAIAECEAAEAEFEVARDAQEDLSALGTYSEEPTDNIAAIFENPAPVAADNNQFEAEGLEIAPAEAEFEATQAAPIASVEPTVAASPAPDAEEGISAASTSEESTEATAPATQEESVFKNVL